jgi:activating signal cointegrator complex subunit 2
MEGRNSVCHVPCPSKRCPKDASLDSADYQEWIERISFIEEDLHSLLALSHHKFWCQAIFDETLQKSLESYLRYAPR